MAYVCRLHWQCWEVIQNHFAVSGNLGDVAAKEEVWVVSAQLIGLGLGILVLVNLKRARILENLHVSNSTVLDVGCEECNKMENILSWEKFSISRIVFGVPLSDMLGGERSGIKVKKLLELYSKEKYIFVVNQQPFKDF